MHGIKIFRALIFLASSVAVCSFAAAKVDVFKEFNAKIEALEKSLPKEKSITKRYDLFLKTYGEIGTLRKDNPRQAEGNELNMAFFTDALISLPAKKDFRERECPKYIEEVEKAAQSNEDTDDEYSKKAVRITKLICRK